MEAGEAVGTMATFLDDDPLCKKDKEPEHSPVWKCRIGRKGSPGDEDAPTAQRLHDNMDGNTFLPSNPPRKKRTNGKPGKYWDLVKCTAGAFPYQSHHLIPKMHLPKHDVCEWLAKKKPGKEWALEESTNYDTDHYKNGLALPFASNTHEWKSTRNAARKTEICNTLMYKTNRQLHQGSHTYTEYDTGEEDSLHEKEASSYLGAVDDLLTLISDAAVTHVQKCKHCVSDDKKPRKVRPLERIVAAVYEASAIIATQIADRDIFVSERAAKYPSGYKPPPEFG